MLHDIPHLIKLETSVLSNKQQNNLLLEAAIIKYKGGAKNKIRQLHCIIWNYLTLTGGNLQHLHAASLLEVIPHILSSWKIFQYTVDETET